MLNFSPYCPLTLKATSLPTRSPVHRSCVWTISSGVMNPIRYQMCSMAFTEKFWGRLSTWNHQSTSPFLMVGHFTNVLSCYKHYRGVGRRWLRKQTRQVFIRVNSSDSSKWRFQATVYPSWARSMVIFHKCGCRNTIQVQVLKSDALFSFF